MSRTDFVTVLGALLVGAMLVSAGVVAAGVTTDAGAQDRTAQSAADGKSNRTISVGASGDASAQPDKAVVRLAVEATADDPSTARNRVAANVTSVREALTEMGLDEDQIRTRDFDLYEDRRERPPRERDEAPETVYRARHTLVVEVDDVDRAGAVVDTAVDNGASSVHDVSFTLSDETRRELRQQALEDAMANAEEQASTIASSAGVSLDRVNRVSTTDTHFPVARTEVAMAAGGDGGGTELNSGPVTVTATVSVTYEISG